MAYPFGWSSITFWAFRSLLEARFQCSYKTLNNPVAIEEDGSMFKARYLERTVNGRKIQCPVDDLKDDQLLMPTQVRRICRRLEIAPRELNIGLHLG